MSRLLPAVATPEDFYRARSRPLSSWVPALQAITARHGLVDAPFSRFSRGESPVFGLGDELVIKLTPALMRPRVSQETDLLEFLRAYPAIPAPRIVARGTLEGWTYLVLTRVKGTPLHEAWPKIPAGQRSLLARACGKVLATLHALPAATNPGGIDWAAFCRAGIAGWPTRGSVLRLSSMLQADGLRYFQAHADTVIKAPRVMLHGDLAPENLMVREVDDRWEIAALIDFGNAMRGDAWFDLVAATILLSPGDRISVHDLLDGYLPGTSSRLAEIRPALMVNALLHPLGDIAACLELIPGASSCRAWDEVALRFWPD